MTTPCWYTNFRQPNTDTAAADAAYERWEIVCCTREDFRRWYRRGTTKHLFCYECPQPCEEEER